MAKGQELATGTLADVFATENATFTKIVAGYTIPVVRRYAEGHICSAIEAQALSAYVLERGASVANSNIDRGSWKDMSDEDKVTKVRDYLLGTGEGSYLFSDNIGSDVFGSSLLVQAATNVLAKRNADKVASMSPSEVRDALAPHVAKLLNDPSLTEKYHDNIEAEMTAILNTKREKRTRTAKAEGGLELEL